MRSRTELVVTMMETVSKMLNGLTERKEMSSN